MDWSSLIVSSLDKQLSKELKEYFKILPVEEEENNVLLLSAIKNFKIKNNLYPNEEIDEEFINLFNSIKNESSK